MLLVELPIFAKTGLGFDMETLTIMGISIEYTPQLVQTEYVGKLDVDEK